MGAACIAQPVPGGHKEPWAGSRCRARPWATGFVHVNVAPRRGGWWADLDSPFRSAREKGQVPRGQATGWALQPGAERNLHGRPCLCRGRLRKASAANVHLALLVPGPGRGRCLCWCTRQPSEVRLGARRVTEMPGSRGKGILEHLEFRLGSQLRCHLPGQCV